MITEKQRAILARALQHPNRVVTPPASLPPGPRAVVARGLIRAGLVDAKQAADEQQTGEAWRLDGLDQHLQVNDAGLHALESAPTQEDCVAHECDCVARAAGVADEVAEVLPAASAAREGAVEPDGEGYIDAAGEGRVPLQSEVAADAAATPVEGAGKRVGAYRASARPLRPCSTPGTTTHWAVLDCWTRWPACGRRC